MLEGSAHGVVQGLEFPTREQCVLPDVLAQRADALADKPYLLFADGSQWSYAETADRAWRAGHGLQRLGVQMQECVAVWAPAGPDVIRCWFGASAIGAVYAPLNLAARGTYLQHMLNVAQARVLVAHSGLLERLVGLDLPHLETIVVTGGAPTVELPWRMLSVAELVEGTPASRPQPDRAIEPWDDLSLIFTSGTTGPSKGVRASHAQQWFYDKCLLWEDVGPDDRLMQALPMFHNAGMCGTSGMLLRGGSVALVDGFQAKTFLDDVRRLQATTTTLVAGMVTFLLNQPEHEDDADNPLRVAYMGPLTRVEEFTKRFGISVFTSFGMTEAPCPIRSGLNPTNEASCGRPIDPADYEVRIVDEHDIPVAPGTSGELVLRHRLPWMINSGYRNMPEATGEAWRGGWFHTGDQLMADEHGDYYFIDRIKDAIRRRGENISSFEVEAEVLTHPAVEEVAAIAVPSPEVGGAIDEEVKIVVGLREGDS